jgi:hypothetical protein
MNTISPSHVPYAELASQARAMLFINALAVVACYDGRRPSLLDMAPRLEAIWNRNRLVLDDLCDPHHMTALLKAHFGPVTVISDEK